MRDGTKNRAASFNKRRSGELVRVEEDKKKKKKVKI